MIPELSRPLPFTVTPHRAEALHSWLMRLSDSYHLKPWQLLHELKVGTFSGRDVDSNIRCTRSSPLPNCGTSPIKRGSIPRGF
jgi:hypothetical protein